MFDPTAFENMKVVLEGAIYDLDLSGEIQVIDRNDWINTAKLSRRFEIAFKLPESKQNSISAKIVVESGLENFVAELLPGHSSEKLAGCAIHLEFLFSNHDQIVDNGKIEKALHSIWGEHRKIVQAVTHYPYQHNKSPISIATVKFDRLIYEEQMDDLVEMIEFMVTTLWSLQALE